MMSAFTFAITCTEIGEGRHSESKARLFFLYHILYNLVCVYVRNITVQFIGVAELMTLNIYLLWTNKVCVMNLS